MSRGDHTGPDGMGPRSGRGLGFCAGYGAPGFTDPGPGYGRRFGRGHGRGFHNGALRGVHHPHGWNTGHYGAYAAPQWSPETEKEFLNGEIGGLKEHLKALEARLNELEEEN